MICRAIPYEGTEPYIFASYCHADKEALFPLFELIVSSGYRIWYDDGNHGGDDWLDNIENHLEECSVCLAFISGNSSLSHNCKSEIIYALKCKKKVIPVLIDSADLPKGMRLLLSHLHYLKRSDFSSDQALLNKVWEAEECQNCKAPAGSLQLRQNNETPHGIPQRIPPTGNFWHNLEPVQLKMGTSPTAPPQKEALPIPPTQSERAIRKETTDNSKAEQHNNTVPDEHNAHAGNYTPADSLDDEVTVYQPYIDDDSSDEPNSDATVISSHVSLALLFHPAANKCFVLRKPQTKLGRSPIKCDAVIEGNNSISKYHADIIQVEQKMFLRDVNSTNGTFIHHNRMEAGSQIELENPSIFQLNNETLVLINRDDAWRMWQDRSAVFLMNEEHTAVQFMKSNIMYLDRNHKWPDGTLYDKKIHRAGHARLQKKQGGVYLIEEAPDHGNGTYLNDSRLNRGEERLLSSGDKIRLGDTTLFFTAITI